MGRMKGRALSGRALALTAAYLLAPDPLVGASTGRWCRKRWMAPHAMPRTHSEPSFQPTLSGRLPVDTRQSKSRLRGLFANLFPASEGGPRRSRGTPPPGPGGPGGPNGDKKGPPPLPPSRGLFGILSFAIVCVLLFMMINSPGRGERITLEQFETKLGNRQIEADSVIVRDDVIEGKLLGNADGNAAKVYVSLNSRSDPALFTEI